jgi:predicted transcriptional regulator of viral defense system
MIKYINPINHGMLVQLMDDVKYPEQKIKYLAKAGKILPLMRGWYLLNEKEGANFSKFHVANLLYGPSYVSGLSALSHYGLISDRSITVTSMVFKRSKNLKTSIGFFNYIYTKKEVFSIGINSVEMAENVNCVLASPTKALYDHIVITPHLTFTGKQDLYSYLEDDLRYDIDRLKELDTKLLEQLANMGSKIRQISILLNLVLSLQ